MTVTEAIERAKDHLVTTIPEVSGSSIQLEELETPPYGSKWRFTFSGSYKIVPNETLTQVLRSRRLAKSVEIDSETGDLLAVKNAVA